MGAKSKISWTDHSFNPWWGCTKVGPGCDACYAEAWDKRHAVMGSDNTGKLHWGFRVERRYFGDKHWYGPLVWNRQAIAEDVRRRVFCASMADVFDNEVDQVHRERLWALIKETPGLDWLLVTKRIGNALGMLPRDWGSTGYGNVWLIATTVNQAELERDGPKLLDIPAAVHGLSVEPMLGLLNLSHALRHPLARFPLDWVICGGESRQPGHEPRPLKGVWAQGLQDQCIREGIAFHFKQAGDVLAKVWGCRDPSGKIPSEWPAWAQMAQQFPEVRR